MIRHLLIFVITAGLGALAALAIRSTLHQPYAEPADIKPQPVPTAPAPGKAPSKPVSDPHAGHAAVPATKPVNDICAICGMDADPKLTATYQQQVIAFGCAKCPDKFAKEPDRYGPYFLKNQEAP